MAKRCCFLPARRIGQRPSFALLTKNLQQLKEVTATMSLILLRLYSAPQVRDWWSTRGPLS
jgi:hypothetical protein